MRLIKYLLPLIALTAISLSLLDLGDSKTQSDDMVHTLYNTNLVDAEGKNYSLSDFQDKTLLLVNTASNCGFTPQYEGLEKLHQDYKDKGLVVIGFPCNQFGGQEPGSEEEIVSFCQKNYGVDFIINEKIEVNGDGTHPLYKLLKQEAPGLLGSEAIKWNFTKFLVGPNAKSITRYASATKPEKMRSDIEALLVH